MRWVEMGGNVFGMGEYCFRMSSCGNMLRCYAPSKRTGMMISTDVLAATRLVHCQGLPLLQQPNVGRKSKASEHQVRSTLTKSDMLDVINLLPGTKGGYPHYAAMPPALCQRLPLLRSSQTSVENPKHRSTRCVAP